MLQKDYTGLQEAILNWSGKIQLTISLLIQFVYLGIYGTAQRQRRKRMQLFCDLRVHIECNEYVLSMRTSLDFRIL